MIRALAFGAAFLGCSFAPALYPGSLAYAQGGCVLAGVGAGSGGERSFTIQPNQVCVIQRRPPTGMSYVDLKILVRPKLGSFGKAGLDAMAYRAGSRPGQDYFEYDSILNAGGQIQHSVVRNFVTIAP